MSTVVNSRPTSCVSMEMAPCPRTGRCSTAPTAGTTADTMIYPFRVRWNQKTFYRTYNQLQSNNERIFTCYVSIDRWLCGKLAVLGCDHDAG